MGTETEQDLREIFDRLGNIEQTMTFIYDRRVSPPNGMIPQIKMSLVNHLQHHEDTEKETEKYRKQMENRKGDKILKVVMIVFQAAVGVILGILASGHQLLK